MICRRLVPSCPVLEPYSPLSTWYNAQFNGIWLPSVEQVDLTLKEETELVELRESPTFPSTVPDTSENPTPRI